MLKFAPELGLCVYPFILCSSCRYDKKLICIKANSLTGGICKAESIPKQEKNSGFTLFVLVKSIDKVCSSLTA